MNTKIAQHREQTKDLKQEMKWKFQGAKEQLFFEYRAARDALKLQFIESKKQTIIDAKAKLIDIKNSYKKTKTVKEEKETKPTKQNLSQAAVKTLLPKPKETNAIKSTKKTTEEVQRKLIIVDGQKINVDVKEAYKVTETVKEALQITETVKEALQITEIVITSQTPTTADVWKQLININENTPQPTLTYEEFNEKRTEEEEEKAEELQMLLAYASELQCEIDDYKQIKYKRDEQYEKEQNTIHIKKVTKQLEQVNKEIADLQKE